MAEVVLFHHAQGLTPGIISFAATVAVQVTSYILPICLQVTPSTVMPTRSIL
jgi:hypothetical protein